MLETRLYQLARLEIDKIRAEQREKEARAKEIERLLKSDKALWKLVSDELDGARPSSTATRAARCSRPAPS